MSDYALRINNRAADAPKKTREDCTQIAAEADKEVERLRGKIEAALDALNDDDAFEAHWILYAALAGEKHG